MNDLMFVAGTRPEIIKISPVLLEVIKRGLKYRLIYSNQHYDYNMSKIFFEELELPDPDNFLDLKLGDQFNQIGRGMVQLESILISEPPKVVIVHGDTDTALFSSIAAAKLGIPLVHIESGLRSFDMEMPEEINRRIIDSISNYCFAPTIRALENLKNEGKEQESILVGDTLVEIAKKVIKLANAKSKILSKLSIKSKNYVLVTIHRKQNIDSRKNAMMISDALMGLETKTILPMHPGTKKKFLNYGILKRLKDRVVIIDPLGYTDFLSLLDSSKLILTDSGGVQQEASIFNTPCLTLRKNTEWFETIESGRNKLVGVDSNRIIDSANQILYDENVYNEMLKSNCPYKIGASNRIVNHLEKSFF